MEQDDQSYISADDNVSIEADSTDEWRQEAIRSLLSLCSSETPLRFPVTFSAIAIGIPLNDFPAASLASIEECLSAALSNSSQLVVRLRDVRSRLPSALTRQILRSPSLFSSDDFGSLMKLIKSDRTLFLSALKLPRFAGLPNAKQHCIDGLFYPSAAVARAALSTLIRRWEEELPKCVDVLLTLSRSQNRILRANVAKALGYVQTPQALSRIRQLMLDGERLVRKEALASLVRLEGVRAGQDLVVSLRDPAPLVRVEACRQIERIRDNSLMEALLQRATDSNSVVRRAALAAIEAIDRDAALQNCTAFRKMPAHVLDDSAEPERSTSESEDLTSESFDPEQEISTLRRGSEADPFIFDLLESLCLAQQIAKSLNSGKPIRNILEEAAEKHTSAGAIAALTLLISNSKRCNSLSRFVAVLIELSGAEPLAEAFLIGLLGFEDSQVQLTEKQLHTLRRPIGAAAAFWKIVSIFGPDPNRLYWPVIPDIWLEEQSDENEMSASSEDLSLATWLRPIMRDWAVLQAQPRHIGFLLSCATPDVWGKISILPGLSRSTLKLLTVYGSLEVPQDVVAAIARRILYGRISDNDPELELLAGMGDRKMQLMVDFGQRSLFIPAVALKLPRTRNRSGHVPSE